MSRAESSDACELITHCGGAYLSREERSVLVQSPRFISDPI